MLLLLNSLRWGLSEFKHYAGVLVILVAVYFMFGPMISKWEDNVHSETIQAAHVTVSQTTPAPGLATVVAGAAEAAKDTALKAAIDNQAIQLSMAQQTIANLAEHAGANAKFASGIAAALTSQAPKRQVVDVVVDPPKASFSPTPVVSDDAIEKDLKHVLASTPLNVQQHSTVTVKWEDKPVSHFFAAYTADGSSGLGYTIRQSAWLNLDGLIVQKVDAGTKVGVGLSHTLKGTAGSLGLAGLVDPRTGKITPEGYVGIHW